MKHCVGVLLFAIFVVFPSCQSANKHAGKDAAATQPAAAANKANVGANQGQSSIEPARGGSEQLLLQRATPTQGETCRYGGGTYPSACQNNGRGFVCAMTNEGELGICAAAGNGDCNCVRFSKAANPNPKVADLICASSSDTCSGAAFGVECIQNGKDVAGYCAPLNYYYKQCACVAYVPDVGTPGGPTPPPTAPVLGTAAKYSCSDRMLTIAVLVDGKQTASQVHGLSNVGQCVTMRDSLVPTKAKILADTPIKICDGSRLMDITIKKAGTLVYVGAVIEANLTTCNEKAAAFNSNP